MFTPTDALNLINAAKEQGCVILGIDAFFLSENTTEPSLEHSIDYSADARSGAATDELAVAFVQARQHMEIYFEVVIATRPI